MKNSTRFLCVVVILSLVTNNLGWEKASKPADKKELPRLVELSFQPAAEPSPALQYLLLPDLMDQTPGNAEPLYSIANNLIINPGDEDSKLLGKVSDWLDLPDGQFPRQDAQKLLETYKNALHYTKLASCREWCQWDISFRTEGYSALLPSLATMRQLARL